MSILVRFPGIARIKALPKERRICLGFLVQGTHPVSSYQGLDLLLQQSLDALSILGRRPLGTVEVAAYDSGNFTMIDIYRDVETLRADEFPLVIGLLRERFQDALVLDDARALPHEEEALEAEMMTDLLDQCRHAPPSKEPLVGFREHGKVLIFG